MTSNQEVFMPQPGEGEEELDLKAIGDEIDGADPAAEEAQEAAADPAADPQTQEGDTDPAARQERTETAAQEIEVAGRKYPSLDHFKRAHDHLYRHSSRLEQELKREREAGKAFGELKKLWREHPDLFTALKKAEADYFAARDAGATPKEARQISRTQNVPPEVMNQLRELREWKDRQEQESSKRDYAEQEIRLKDEFSQLRTKYKLEGAQGDAVIDKVTAIMLEKAQKGDEWSAEDAYELLLVRDSRSARNELARVQAHSDTGTSNSGQVKPPTKTVGDMNDREFDAELESWAKTQGL